MDGQGAQRTKIGAVLDLQSAPVAHADIIVVYVSCFLSPVVDCEDEGVTVAEDEIEKQVVAKSLIEAVVVPGDEQKHALLRKTHEHHYDSSLE